MTAPHSCKCFPQQPHFGARCPRRTRLYFIQSDLQSVQRLQGCRLLQTCRRSQQVFCVQGKGNNTQEEKPRKQQAVAPLKGSHQKPPGDNSEADTKWGIFQWDRYAEPWEVPWGGKELAIGMGSWAASFVLVGLVLAPLVVKAAGVTLPDAKETVLLQNYSTLTATDKSFLVLANQVAETVVGIAVIRRAIGASTPLPEDENLFKISWRQPFAKPRGWLAWGLLGILLSPVVIGVTVTIVSYAGYEAVGGQGTADGVARIISLDFPTYASLLTVTGVLAPFLEETVFRGFLLTTLTKWMPTPAAVVLSATAFGLAHLSPRDLPQLIGLGTLLGFSYVRSRNLLTPMIIHGAWNSVVLTVLFALTASGVNVSEMLSSGG